MKDHGRAQETVVIGAIVRSSSAYFSFRWVADAGLVQRCCVEVLRFCCADSCQAFMGERLLTNRYACYLAYKLSTAQA